VERFKGGRTIVDNVLSRPPSIVTRVEDKVQIDQCIRDNEESVVIIMHVTLVSVIEMDGAEMA
jgi:hypothetical protein